VLLLSRRIGAWSWRHKGARLRRMKRWKNFAAPIGRRSIHLFGATDGRLKTRQDLTQGFFARLLERRDFDAVRHEKGRLRSYLLTSVKHFLINERERATSIKRGEGRALIPLDEIISRERNDPEPADVLTADKIYERRWALTVLNQVLARLEEEDRSADRAKLFERFKELLADDQISQAAPRLTNKHPPPALFPWCDQPPVPGPLFRLAAANSNERSFRTRLVVE
jgi:DNA-directed RNA polymerase specialized sigma24 family protein